ncbi:MAG TPA: amidohydrolase family protein, partial [Croceibacterium sp.]|nr:amidohydrolase family protein [Croceibacterium sp.]
AGVTTVVHHDRWEPDFEDDFPLHVPRIAWANSLGMPPGPEAIDPARRFCLHVAEGTNAIAADEVRQLQAMGLLGPNLVAVHGLGMDEDAVERFRASGAALVWCPSSNQYLFGRTVPAGLVSPGVDVLLGSDSLLTGAGNLLDELRLARGLGLLSDQRLEAAVGEVAARRLGLRAPSLEPGEPADIVVLSRPLLEASAEDVWLVVVDGIPRVVAPALAPFSGTARLATVGGVTRWVEPGGRKHRSAMNRMAPWANLQREAPGKFTRGMRA